MLQEELDKAVTEFGDKLAKDLNESLNEALKRGGSNNVQEAALNFEPKYIVENGSVQVQIIASDVYWKYIEYGRKPGKMPPPSKLGKKWQVSQGIDPRKVMYEINLKSKGLKKQSKKLTYDRASKQLAFIIARSIGKKGLKPRPYLYNVIDDGRVTAFAETIAKILSKDITLQLIIK